MAKSVNLELTDVEVKDVRHALDAYASVLDRKAKAELDLEIKAMHSKNTSRILDLARKFVA